MQAVPVTEGIHWVGVIDWNLRDFHGYETPRGSTYNAYLVQGRDKVALVDTVKTAFVPELLSRVESLVDPAKIDVIVVNHVEPDHNSGLREVVKRCPNARVVASRAGVQGIAEYHDGLAADAVGADDVIDLGERTLHFAPQPMLHWPDSMFTWCPESNTLMPNDAFGQHVASSARFADDVGMGLALEELEIYFANILMPLGKQVGKAIAQIDQSGWDCRCIAPSHGVIWRGAEAIKPAMAQYCRWASHETVDRAVVAYSTMWGSTTLMAAAVEDGIAAEGVEAFVFDLATSRVADITYRLLEARGLALGSSTIHRGMLYRASGYLQYLEGLHPEGKLAAVFGSFGWGGGACKQMAQRLEGIGFELPFEELTMKYAPDDGDLERCREWGSALGRAVRERAARPQREPAEVPAPAR